jgi:hypothetical protein
MKGHECSQEPPAPSAELIAKNREVQRLLGRCLLRIQQLEKLLKAIVTAQHHYGSGADSAKFAMQRASQVAKLGMGDLVDYILAGMLQVRTGQVGPDGLEVERPSRKGASSPQAKTVTLARRYDKAQAKALAERRPWFTSTVTISVAAEVAKEITDRLTLLVQLRNRVVHHFCDDHEVRTEAGCGRATVFLEQTDAALLQHMDHLSKWARELDETRIEAARAMCDPAVVEQMFSFPAEGAPPDEPSVVPQG